MKHYKPIRIFEAFAGMGAQRKALTNIKAKYEISGMAEWFVPAIVSYQAIHNNLKNSSMNKKVTRKEMIKFLDEEILSMDSKNPVKKGYWKNKSLNDLIIIFNAVKRSKKEGNIFDVRKLSQRGLDDIDLLTYSFPCQDLSQQGKQMGLARNTRSGLLWEIEKALDNSKTRPRFLLMENVTALLNKTFKKDLDKWIKKLEMLGYKNEIGILNSGDFGSPQARKRVFMISSLNGYLELPRSTKKPDSIKSILDRKTSRDNYLHDLDKYSISEFRLTKSNINKATLMGYTSFNSEAYIYDKRYTGPTLTASGANSRIKIKHNSKIRKLNARELYKYMGFTVYDFNKVKKLKFLTEAKMIYTCGNSISVQVLEEIMKKIERNHNA